ncbi:MAG: T9SS type A sorting domain-containing protein [bacterium]|nr:T9SS type A sorting domain-containing protein [bacterium]
MGFCVQETQDSGFIVTGYTMSYGAGNCDVWLIRTDKSGDTLWTNTFGGTGEDWGKCVQETEDGGFIVVGRKSLKVGIEQKEDVWLIKTDSLGNKLWDIAYGKEEFDDGGFDIKNTKDGGFIITGYTCSYSVGGADVWLIKTDSLGNKLWDKTYGGEFDDRGYSVDETEDGGFVITGETWSYSSLPGWQADIWLIRTNELGDILWTKTYGGDYEDVGMCVQEVQGGGFFVTGWTLSFVPETALRGLWSFRTDELGNKLWDKFFYGRDALGFFGKQTRDGGFIIAGQCIIQISKSAQVLLIRLDKEEVEEKIVMSVEPDTIIGPPPAVGDTFVDSIYISNITTPLLYGWNFGMTFNPEVLHCLKVEEGPFLKEFGQTLFGVGPIDNDLGDIQYVFCALFYPSPGATGSGTIAYITWQVMGHGSSPLQLKDVTLADPNANPIPCESKDGYFELPTGVIETATCPYGDGLILQSYPNPIRAEAMIRYEVSVTGIVSLKVYNITGELVATIVNEKKAPGYYSAHWSSKTLPNGVYFCRLEHNSKVITQKLVIVK